MLQAVVDQMQVSMTTPACIGVVMAIRRVAGSGPVRIRPSTTSTNQIDARPTGLRIGIGSHRVHISRWALMVSLVGGVVSPMIGLSIGTLLLARAVAAPRRAARRLHSEWAAHVPDLVELVRLALGSGCTVHLSLLLIAEHAGGPIRSMLERTVVALQDGASTVEALIDLQDRVGTPVRPLCAALLGSERYGLPVSATLEALAVEARLARRRHAELRSRRLPVLLIFPLVVCILPAFALLTVVPLLGGGLSSLSW